jgi:hypothetical protein
VTLFGTQSEARPGAGELRRVIAGVRRRWRLKVLLKGAALTIGFGLVAFAVSAYGMDHFRYTPWAIATFRILTWAALLGLTLRFVVLPLATRLPDERVALYIEEHDPSLQAALLSAVGLGERGSDADSTDLSPALVRRLVERAVELCQDVDYGRLVEGRSLQRFSGALAGVATAGMVGALLSPAFVRQAVPFLLAPWSFGDAQSPYSIRVEPGHQTVARGSDVTVVAQLEGFDSHDVELSLRDAEGEWRRQPMTADVDNPGFRYMLLDLTSTTDYFVESSGVRSGLYRLDVVEVPYVERIDLEYRFPEYTGLSPVQEQDGGDIAALRGTEVELRITPTVPVSSGRLAIEGEEPRMLNATGEGVLVAMLEVNREGFYKIELPNRSGGFDPASSDYAIEVLADQPPLVRFLKPGRDAQATPIEEVFTEAQAEDDFGIARLELVYSINGAPEEAVTLHRGRRALKELSAGHTFFLEEYELEPGDFVSYYARAVDNRAVPDPQQSSTDIYFMQVRPFGRAYRQAAQGGQAGGGGNAGGTLSHQQRQIVAATFNLVRDRGTTPGKQWREDLATLALLQGRLREQVETLTRRMLNRGVLEAGSEMAATAESLQHAISEMASAEEELGDGTPKDALPPEQRALQHLQRAEAAFAEVQVAFGQGGGGGDGGGMSAEDLADLFELELDKLQNQYEAVQRGERRQLDEAVDEATQRLQELARRQEQENERLRQRGARAPNQAGGAGGQQRQLADQAEELGRKLERLAREHSSPSLQDTARRLKDAADAMRRAGASGEERSLAHGISALDKLKDARRLLDRDREDRTEREMADAVRQAEAIERAQRRISADVRDLGAGTGAGAGEKVAELDERKDALGSQVATLEEQLDRMARESRRTAKEASRELQEAAGQIRESKLKEKIRYSKGVVRERPGETAQQFEDVIGADIGELRKRVAAAASTLSEKQGDSRSAALERTRDLVRRVESMEERVREGGPGGEDDPGRADAASGEQPGAEGAPTGEVGEGRGALGTTGGGSGFRPGVWDPRWTRQLRREFRERAEELRGIAGQLGREGTPGDLREIERKLRRLESDEPWGDPRGVEELVTAALEDLKMFEYALRRELEGIDPEKLRLSGSAEVPEGWRELVEEYYRSLASGQ